MEEGGGMKRDDAEKTEVKGDAVVVTLDLAVQGGGSGDQVVELSRPTVSENIRRTVRHTLGEIFPWMDDAAV